MGVEFDPSDVDFSMMDRIGPDFLEYAALDFWAESQQEAPVGVYPEGENKGGTLRGSIQYSKQDDYQWIIGTGLEYAPSVHDGSRAHEIVAKNAKALGPIQMSGTYLGVTHSGTGFFKRVWHPGYEGNPFFTRAQDTIEGKLDEYLDMAMRDSGLT